MSKDSTAVQGTRRSIENFRGDYHSLSTLLERSWSENSQQALYYSPEFLQSFLTAPGATPSLAPAFYEGDTLIGFAAGFTRNVEFRGRPLRLMTSTLLSVLPEYKKTGFGIVLWSELVKRARAQNFDGMLNFCVDGEPMNRMVEGSCRRLNLPVQRILSVRYMSALLKPADIAVPSSSSNASSLNDFLALAYQTIASQPLARKWTVEEAEWQCLQRTGGVFAHASYGPRRGALTGYVMPILDAERTKCLLVEDIFWGELQPEERLQLLNQFLSQAKSQGAQMATLPILGYADMTAFKKSRFFPTRRVLHCYLTLFNGDLAPEALPSMYLDVF